MAIFSAFFSEFDNYDDDNYNYNYDYGYEEKEEENEFMNPVKAYCKALENYNYSELPQYIPEGSELSSWNEYVLNDRIVTKSCSTKEFTVKLSIYEISNLEMRYFRRTNTNLLITEAYRIYLDDDYTIYTIVGKIDDNWYLIEHFPYE